MTVKQDLNPLKIGNTLLQEFQLTDKASGEGLAQAGKQYFFSLKRNVSKADDDSDASISFTCPDDELSAAGVILVRIDASVIATLTQSHYFYELTEITPDAPEPIVTTWFSGKIKLEH